MERLTLKDLKMRVIREKFMHGLAFVGVRN